MAVVLAAACGPSLECQLFVACQEAIDDDVDVSAWSEGGSCWQGSLPLASTCTAQCREALEALRTVPDAPDVCFR
jgi:hypothetical protein